MLFRLLFFVFLADLLDARSNPRRSSSSSSSSSSSFADSSSRETLHQQRIRVASAAASTLSAHGIDAGCDADGPVGGPTSCPAPLGAGGLTLAWATPIMRFDVTEVEGGGGRTSSEERGESEGGGEVDTFNAVIRDAVLAEYAAFLSPTGGCGSGTPCAAKDSREYEYNAFFREQMKVMPAGEGGQGHSTLGTGLKRLVALPEYRRLVAHIQEGIDEYLLAAGHPPPTLAMRSRDLQVGRRGRDGRGSGPV